MSKKEDDRLYAMNNILALSLKHYDMTLQKEAKLRDEEINFEYERLDREEQEPQDENVETPREYATGEQDSAYSQYLF